MSGIGLPAQPVEPEVPKRPRFGRDRVESRHEADIAKVKRLTRFGSGVCSATVEDDFLVSYSITSLARTRTYAIDPKRASLG